MAFRVAPSAGKHGVTAEDILTVLTRPVHRVDQFDRGPGGPTTLFIGLSCTGRMLEVLALITPPADVFVFHAMLLRPETAARAGFYDQEED